ncbi:uncharacterized protein LOC105632145 [Jatropha curcas]|uniref:uncharacterized protein LOC105632145 n=1 Tax=Jatropha curcas TaxID=180498 RepID=UPI00189327A8|nr:uncharacterized protein LOC105632145 [Jatropha curcas]
MGISKTEINLRRLLAAAPRQQNQAKLIHYVATLREQLEQLAEERTLDGLPRVSKAKVNDYSEKIEAIASRLAAPLVRCIGYPSIVQREGENKYLSKRGTRIGVEAFVSYCRKLQEDLTDEMVGLAQQLKESSLLMSQSLQNTEKILDSTENAIEQSLAGTGRANVRALEIYSKSSKTTCFTWLLIFLMTCVFIMVVLLIRVT